MTPKEMESWAPAAKIILLSAGVVGVMYVAKGETLEEEDRSNLLKVIFGVPVFIAALSYACSKGKWSWCAEQVPKWPV
jgi:hypothetical protein